MKQDADAVRSGRHTEALDEAATHPDLAPLVTVVETLKTPVAA
ncbi:hypothetical protein [Streptomyces tagetis]|nr:hypothetical protein [Streptomyces sp. RG38]